MLIRGGNVITVASGKGGVGKTFLAINIAGLISKLEKKVLLIDLDLYSGGVGVSLNINNSASIYDLCEDIKNHRYQTFEHYVTKYNEFIDVLLAPNDPRDAIKMDPTYLSNIISYAKNKYDAVIIDTTHVFDKINVVALEKSDHIIEVMTNDPLDIKNMTNIVKLFNATGIQNFTVVLNESVHPDKNYYALFDIKNIIKANLDYVISKHLYLKNYDKFVIDGEILSLHERTYNKYKTEWLKLEKLISDLMVNKKAGVK